MLRSQPCYYLSGCSEDVDSELSENAPATSNLVASENSATLVTTEMVKSNPTAENTDLDEPPIDPAYLIPGYSPDQVRAAIRDRKILGITSETRNEIRKLVESSGSNEEAHVVVDSLAYDAITLAFAIDVAPNEAGDFEAPATLREELKRSNRKPYCRQAN